MLVVGCFEFAGGIFISIKNQPSPKLLKNAYASSSGTANKIITDIMPSGWKKRRSSSTTIQLDLIAKRLGQLEKFRDKAIVGSELGKKEKVTEDESSQ
jgi:hypothetical protein